MKAEDAVKDKPLEGAVGVAKVTKKGQVTIPQVIREEGRITPGTSLVFIQVGDTIFVNRAEDLEDLFRAVRKEARRLGITREEVEEAVKEARRKTVKKSYAQGLPKRLGLG